MKKILIALILSAGVVGLAACGPVPQKTSSVASPSPTTSHAPPARSTNPSVQTWWAELQPYHHEIGETMEAIAEFADDGEVTLVKSSCVVLADNVRQAQAHVRPAPDAIVTTVVAPYEKALVHFSTAASACQRGNWSTLTSELGYGTSYVQQATAGVTAYTTSISN